jgi:hypothetical protein
VVTGGYVYRGPDSSLQGKYFFLDSRNSAGTTDDNYWMFDPANPRSTVMNIDSQLAPNTGSRMFPVSFGEDALGRLYIAYIGSGEVYRIKMAGDYDGDNDVDSADYEMWQETFGTTGRGMLPAADGNNNNTVDAADYVVWRKNLSAPMPGAASNIDATVPEASALTLLVSAVGSTLLFRCCRRLARELSRHPRR